MNYTVHGILQARIVEWVDFPFYRGPSQPRDGTQVSYTAGRFFTKMKYVLYEILFFFFPHIYHTLFSQLKDSFPVFKVLPCYFFFLVFGLFLCFSDFQLHTNILYMGDVQIIFYFVLLFFDIYGIYSFFPTYFS